MITQLQTQLISPNSFEAHLHWYPKALNATIHPMVNFFINLERDRIVSRYCHLRPMVDREKLMQILSEPTKQFLWCGADVMHVTAAGGKKEMVVIENNSCPSGQKSMPLLNDNLEQGGYKELIEKVFKPFVESKRSQIQGGLAVLYDKNEMEVTGYAAVIADVMEEPVYLVPCFLEEESPSCRFVDGVLEILTDMGSWIPIRAAFKYVTQKPWNRIPLHTKTKIFNPILVCLAGGRNKLLAAKAYDIYNAELAGSGLKIEVPETIWDVNKGEVPIWIKKLGGHGVVKVPYSNAGQGVFTILSKRELDDFMNMDFQYDRFIVQSLIGNYNWSSTGKKGKLYQVGTVPDARGNSYVADLRVMVGATPDGVRPICLYSRRAPDHLEETINDTTNSWQMLGTNLSTKDQDGNWITDTNRLLLMDRKDFNKLGIGLDELLEAYIQTVLSMKAIDNLTQTLISTKGKFKLKLFSSLNDDPALIRELIV